MNQQELADRLGVSQQTISKYENGEREPDHNTLTKISELFSVSIDYLLGQTDIRNPYDESNIENYTNEIEDILETIHKRPEIKALFSLSKKASKEDVEKTLKIIEALKGD
jgi:transcriptional regulator with XRE-family HTH domain